MSEKVYVIGVGMTDFRRCEVDIKELAQQAARDALKDAGVEWKDIGKLQTHHYHTRNPKEEDIQTGLQQRCWVKGSKVLGIVGRMGEAGHRQSDTLAREELQGAQLVARAGDGDRFIDRVDAHHFELPHHRRAVKRYRGTDSRDDGVDVLDGLALVVDAGPHGRDVHVAALVVENQHLMAALLARLHQAARGIQPGIGGKNRDFQWTSPLWIRAVT